MNLYSLISTGSNQTMSIVTWAETSSLQIPGFNVLPYSIPEIIPISKSISFYSDYEFELLSSQSFTSGTYNPISIGTSSMVSWSIYSTEYISFTSDEIPEVTKFEHFSYPEFIRTTNSSSLFGFNISILNDLLNTNKQNFIEISNTKTSSSLYDTVNSIKNTINGDNKRKEIAIVTRSMAYTIPTWAEEAIVITIGGGGAGGGGVKPLSGHEFAVGGAGGAGGNISYTRYTNLKAPRVDMYETGSITKLPKTYKVHCLLGPKAKGGIAYTGSGHWADLQLDEYYNSYGNSWLKNLLYFYDIIGGNHAYSEYGDHLSAEYWKQYAVNDQLQALTLGIPNSMSYAPVFGHWNSKGEDGPNTTAVLIRTSIGQDDGLTYTDTLDQVKASGGAGGWPGRAFASNPNVSSSFERFTSEMTEPWFPISKPGGSEKSNQFNIGEVTLVGGPGGHGISLPLINTASFAYAKDWEKYVNSAPSLPLGIRKSLTDTTTDPYQYPKGILKFAWGVGRNQLPDAIHTPSTSSLFYDWGMGINNPLYPSDFIYLNQRIPWYYLPTQISIPFESPSEIAPTGGGGGTGWVKTVGTPSPVQINESYLSIGTGGKLTRSKYLFEYQISTGGNGGNLSTLNSLSVTSPTSGTGPGAGGGGGASSNPNGTPQNGADGNIGAVVIISLGESFGNVTPQQ